MIEIILGILGVVLLVLGKRLVWLFVSVVGFLIGIYLAERFFSTGSENMYLTVAIIVGVLFAILSLFLKKFIIGSTGFVLGGYLAYVILNLVGVEVNYFFWLIVFGSGVAGALLVALLFNWAVVILSSVVGAGILVNVLKLQDWVALSVFIVLIIAGLYLQSRY